MESMVWMDASDETSTLFPVVIKIIHIVPGYAEFFSIGQIAPMIPRNPQSSAQDTGGGRGRGRAKKDPGCMRGHRGMGTGKTGEQERQLARAIDIKTDGYQSPNTNINMY